MQANEVGDVVEHVDVAFRRASGRLPRRGEAMRRRGGKPPEQLREDVTGVVAAVPALPVASVDVHGGTITPDNGRGVVGFEDEPRGGHVMRGEIPSDVPRGAHVMKDDPLLAIERRAVHAAKGPALALPDLSTFTPESSPVAVGVSDLAPAIELSAASVGTPRCPCPDRVGPALAQGKAPTKRRAVGGGSSLSPAPREPWCWASAEVAHSPSSRAAPGPATSRREAR